MLLTGRRMWRVRDIAAALRLASAAGAAGTGAGARLQVAGAQVTGRAAGELAPQIRARLEARRALALVQFHLADVLPVRCRILHPTC